MRKTSTPHGNGPRDRPSCTGWKPVAAGFPLVTLLIVASYALLDKRAALFVKMLWMSSPRSRFFSAEIPDILLFLVYFITAGAWIAFLFLSRRGGSDRHARFFLLIGVTVPGADLMKSLFKYAFGRITTRFWLQHPGFREFHWFHGAGHYSGFPSGHMAVFTVLALALGKYYPRRRTLYGVSLAVLALALVATNYHFVSDIIAGAYLGLVVHAAAGYVLDLRRKTRGGT